MAASGPVNSCGIAMPVKKCPPLLGRSMSCEFSSLGSQFAGSSNREANYLFPSLDPCNGTFWEIGDVNFAENDADYVAGYVSQSCSNNWDIRVVDDLDVNYRYTASEACGTPRSESGELFVAASNKVSLPQHLLSSAGVTSRPFGARSFALPPLNLAAANASHPFASSATSTRTDNAFSARRSSSDRGACDNTRVNSQSPSSFRRDRACSLPDAAAMDCFIQLDTNWLLGGSNTYVDQAHRSALARLVSKADAGMKCGVEPTLADGALGGTYFLHDSSHSPCVICKPGDEEPNGPWNPHSPRMKWASYKGRIIPGFGMYREVATYLLNGSFVGVPPTALARVRHRLFRSNSILRSKPVPRVSPATTATALSNSTSCKCCDSSDSWERAESVTARGLAFEIPKQRGISLDSYESTATTIDRLSCESHGGALAFSSLHTSPVSTTGMASSSLLHNPSEDDVWESSFSYKPCSVQAFVSHECSAEDMGPAMFCDEDVQRIAMLDIRMCNLDRHEGNYLVAESNPYSLLTNTFQSDRKYRLIPIDHGYCLPHVLYMNGASLSWLYWPQARQPVLPAIAEYIANIDVNVDIACLKRCIGVAMPDPCLLTLRICTMFLQKGVRAGLTLFDIGSAMTEALDGSGGSEYLDEIEYKHCEVMFSSRLMKVVVNSIKSTYSQYLLCSIAAPQPLVVPVTPTVVTPVSHSPPKSPERLASTGNSPTARKCSSTKSTSISGSCITSLIGRIGGTRTLISGTPRAVTSSVPAASTSSVSPTPSSSTLADVVPLVSTPAHTVASCIPSLTSMITPTTASYNSLNVSLEVKLTAAINFQGGRAFLNELEHRIEALVAEILASK